MSLLDLYLGRPESPFGMLVMPAVPVGSPIGGTGGMSPSHGRGTVAQALMSGGTTASHKPDLKTTYQLQWHLLKQDAKRDLLLSFYDGRQQGPYCLVDPSESNWLPPNVASLGAVKNALGEWTVSAGALATSTAAGPTGLITGVANWTGAANTNTISMGLPSGVIDSAWLPPVIQGKSHRMSIYGKLVSGSGTLTASIPYGNAGVAPTGNATVTATGVVLSTSTWQEVSAVVASSFSWGGFDYLAMKLTVSSATSPNILLAAASMIYDDGTTAPALNPWVSGIGVPRVVVPAGVDSPVGRPGLRDWTMQLAQG